MTTFVQQLDTSLTKAAEQFEKTFQSILARDALSTFSPVRGSPVVLAGPWDIPSASHFLELKPQMHFLSR